MAETEFDNQVGRLREFERTVLRPLERAGRGKEMDEAARAFLAEITDPEVRKITMGTVSSWLHCCRAVEESWAWCERAVDEAPDDPIAQNRLATWFFYSPLSDPEPEDLELALEFNAEAVRKARTSNTWRRNVLHDRCRIAVAAGRHDLVAEAMAEILEVWNERTCIPDIPMFEWDWLDKVPAGAIDPDLLGRYEAMVAEVLRRRDERDEALKADARVSVFEFSATARRRDGSTEPFTLTIFAANHDPQRGWNCVLSCPFLDNELLRIFGIDQRQAFELAVDFVRQSLGHMEAILLDGEGNPVQIPEPSTPQEPAE